MNKHTERILFKMSKCFDIILYLLIIVSFFNYFLLSDILPIISNNCVRFFQKVDLIFPNIFLTIYILRLLKFIQYLRFYSRDTYSSIPFSHDHFLNHLHFFDIYISIIHIHIYQLIYQFFIYIKYSYISIFLLIEDGDNSLLI